MFFARRDAVASQALCGFHGGLIRIGSFEWKIEIILVEDLENYQF
jgi:hypothetical protein